MQKSAKRMEKRAGRLLLLTPLAAIGLTPGCSHGNTYAIPPKPVRVSAVEAYEAGAGIRYSANIEPYTQVNLAFKSGGYVRSILQRKGADGRMRGVQTGDRVTKGEVLAHVRESEYVDKVHQARAELAQAQASYEQAKLDFERASNLFSTESVTKSQYDAAKAKYDSSTGSVNQANAALAQAETALNDCALKSPLTGWVLERDVEAGNFVAAGTVGFVLSDTHLVKAAFGVPDTMIESVRPGDPQSIITPALPGEFHGRITAISPSADPKSRVFSVEVTLPNPHNQLKAGMIATLTLAGAKLSHPILVVPLSAVIRSSTNSNGFAVFVAEEQGGKTIAHERNVQAGETYGNTISVTQGVKIGERVVVVGATQIRDGEQIQVIP